MITTTYLAEIVANEVWEEGKRRDWWPFSRREDFDGYRESKKWRFPGNGTHVVVGLDGNQQLIVREIQSITDTACVSSQAFVLSYSHLQEGRSDGRIS